MRLGILAIPFFAVNVHRAYAEMTLSTIRSSSHELLKIAVINRCRPEKGDDVWLRQNFDCVEANDQNILARAWNRGIHLAFERGCEYVAVINLDVLFHPDHFDRLLEFAEQTKERALVWSGCGVPEPEQLQLPSPIGSGERNNIDFCAYLIDRRLFQRVGEFDEAFAPAYHEDKDMLYRITLAGESVLATEQAAFFHFERGTQAGLLEDYYAKKGMEVFGDPALGARAMSPLEEVKSVEEIYADTSMALFGETTLGVEATFAQYVKKWGGPPGEERFIRPYQQE